MNTNEFLIAQAQTNQTIFNNQVPSIPSYSDGGASYELGMKFQSSKAGQITAIRFWKAVNETGIHVGRIWSSTGYLIDSVNFSSETPSGWQVQTLSTPIQITANTIYVVSVNINEYYAVTVDDLASPVINGDLSSIADNNNGVFANPTTFPTSSYRNSNYFRDIVFVANNTVAPTSVTRVNSGGTNYTDTSGALWSADTGFVGGSTYLTNTPIANTNDSALYQSERYGNLTYSLPVTNGIYTLRLHFAEIYFTSAGLRRFNVTAQGQQILTNFDIYAESGAANTALIKSFPVTVSNGTLQLSFASVVENPKISAIELIGSTQPTIIKVSGDNQSTAVGTTLPNPLVVQVKDAAGNPQPGVTINFVVTNARGSVSPTSASTNNNGQASTVLSLNTTAGDCYVSATASGIGSVTFTALASVTNPNPIYLENQKPGTTDWQITNYSYTEITGYATETSVNKGGSLGIKVSLAQPGPFKIDVYRLGYYDGKGGRLLLSSGTFNGVTQPPLTLTDPNTKLYEATNWSTSYTIAVGGDWTSGLYIAKLTDLATNKQSQVWFVVRDDSSTSDILFQSSFTTYSAYNNTGGYSVYAYNSIGGQRGFKVSYDRPLSMATTDPTHYNLMTLWERNLARWLESQSYNVSYVTNMDIQTNPLQLGQHKAFLSVGHDEYWSLEERNAVEQARNAGVNLAFFSANTCYWRVRFENSNIGVNNRVMACYKDDLDPVAPTNKWRSTQNNRPENALIGVMYTGDRDSLYNTWTNIYNPSYGGYDFVVSNSNDPYYAHTGLNNGDSLSQLVGFEWDAVINNGSSPNGLVTLSQSSVNPTSIDSDLPPGTNTQRSNAVRYTAASGAKVFSTGSIQWMWGLDSDRVNPSKEDNRVKQMTVNVLADMGAKPQLPDPYIIVP